jgi:hypothetical protein
MQDERFEFGLELSRRATGELVGRANVKVDWAPVEEHLMLKLVRGGEVEDFDAAVRVTLEPVWSKEAPVVRGVKATAVAQGARPASMVVTLDYFRALAQRAANRLVEVGKLRSGELFEYRVVAKECAAKGNGKGRRIVMEAGGRGVNVLPGRMDELMGRAIGFGGAEERDVPVFVDWGALEEASILTREAGELETGGILVGYVRRDAETGEIFLEVTAQVPARAKSQLTRLSFGPQTWTDLDGAVNGRGKNEVWLGWWHSHSFFKKAIGAEGEEETAGESRVARAFLSEEDVLLHRSVFPRAYSVALLLTDSPRWGLSWTLFGWRGGMVAQRGFHVVNVPMPKNFFSLRGGSHAKV